MNRVQQIKTCKVMHKLYIFRMVNTFTAIPITWNILIFAKASSFKWQTVVTVYADVIQMQRNLKCSLLKLKRDKIYSNFWFFFFFSSIYVLNVLNSESSFCWKTAGLAGKLTVLCMIINALIALGFHNCYLFSV